ncbi:MULTISPECIES: hypothetical protein [Solibacillus]|uniref:hypothetical protein n=1 Tax=Solibacillus TaxID=648800 RepID=UPI00203CFD80|nr:hypothetical protein [Solibacillus isronensis]MCM3723752.1 hypothetical protein [Solibacillus isronensis]
MTQQNSSKEMSGNKMVKIIVGTILVASIVIVIAIQAFYMLWEPKDPKQIELNKSEESSNVSSVMLPFEEQLYLG